jgi:glutathione S-transferase
MVEELGIPYTHEPIRPPNTRSPELLKINPNGHVPAIVDGELALFESMAINLYLAAKYGRDKGLWPTSVEDQGRAMQWSFWAITEIEPHTIELLAHRAVLPEARRTAETAKAAEEKLHGALSVLEGALHGRSYLVSDAFDVADLNVASVLSLARILRVDMSRHACVSDWLGRCLARPVVRKAQGR